MNQAPTDESSPYNNKLKSCTYYLIASYLALV